MNVIIAETDNGPSKIGTRCLRGIDAVTCNVKKRRITVNPCRGARIISYRNFSPFSAFVKSLKQSEEPPCNPESLGPESSCLAGRLESGFVSSGTIQQIDKLKKEEGVRNRQAIQIELFYWRCESGNAFWTSGAVCAGGSVWQDDTEMRPGRGVATI